MPSQQFNPQTAPQRMQTISPSPFSPPTQAYGSQASPPNSEHGNQVGPMQNGLQSYMSALSFNGTAGQQFAPQPGLSNGIHPAAQYPQGPLNIQQQQQRMQEIRQHTLARQMQMSNAAAQHRMQQGGALNPSPSATNLMLNYQMASRPQAAPPATLRARNPDELMRSIGQFMQQRGQQWNSQPTACGRPYHVAQLFMTVIREGGSKRITAQGLWPQVAARLQIHPAQYPTAAHEIQMYWHTTLLAYENFWLQQEQRRRAAMEQMQIAQQSQGPDGPLQDHLSPAKPLHLQPHDAQRQQSMQNQQQAQAEYQAALRQMAPPQQDSRHQQQNGFGTPPQVHAQNRQLSSYGIQQPGQPIPPQATPPQTAQSLYSNQPHSASKKTPSSISGQAVVVKLENDMPRQIPIGPQFVPKHRRLEKGKEGVESHGGLEVSSFAHLIDEYVKYKPDVPDVQEMGLIDIRTLTLSLRSGLHAEVRLALDTIVALSSDLQPPDLRNCEDLVETLIGCAEEQVEILAEHSIEVSDMMLVTPYEELVRGCRAESETLQGVTEFGSLDHDLDRSVDRIICITTILRNFSFSECNHKVLADQIVIKFLATVIRYLGTFNLLFRSYRNTLDFTKDVVILLSNLAQTIKLPGKEEALCILHFLLSFAPLPSPTLSGNEDILFPSYVPAVHPYFPPAVDSLAKLLACDDPNRAFYRSIFAADSSSTPPNELLTRAFALAVAPVPSHGRVNISATVDARKPFLTQGMLAADILTSLIPGSEHALAKSWLSSQDGFALSLVRLVSVSNVLVPLRNGRAIEPDVHTFNMITNRGLSVLRKLAEKIKNSETSSVDLPEGLLLKKSNLLETIMSKNTDPKIVKNLCAFTELDI